MRKPTWFLNRSDKNQAEPAQQMARFGISDLRRGRVLQRTVVKTKALISCAVTANRKADLHLCFRIMQIVGFLIRQLSYHSSYISKTCTYYVIRVVTYPGYRRHITGHILITDGGHFMNIPEISVYHLAIVRNIFGK